MTHQGPPPQQRGKTSAPSRQYWPDADDTDSDLPPWAGLGFTPRRGDSRQPGRRPRRGQRGHGEHSGPGPDRGQAPLPGSRRQRALARARRSRRTMYSCAAALAVIIAAAVVAVPRLLPHATPQSPLGNLVTTFQPGEMRAVPNACTAVTTATLDRYLPGARHKVVPHSLDGNAQSMCDWTVDAPPTYRLLDVTVQAYAPSGLARGNGSATNAAIDAYQQAMQRKAHPPRASRQPAATVAPLPGTGSAAFSALQVLSAGGDKTDLVTTVIRERNVLITVVLDGLAHSPGGRYGPVPVSQLRAGAAAAARNVLAALH